MALVACKECGKEVSTQAKACPNCGAAPPRKPTIDAPWFIGAVGAIVIGLMIHWDLPSVAKSRLSPPPKSEWTLLAESADPEDKKNVAEIETMQWFDVCDAWGAYLRAPGPGSRRGDALRFFLRHQKLINPLDEENTGQSRVAVGMTACGTVAAYGRPDSVNTTTTGRTTSQQIVYRAKRTYVYTESSSENPNGIVRSIQH